MTKTIIGLFDSLNAAQDVVKDLVDNGFTHDHISLVSQETEQTQAVGEPHEEDAAGRGAMSGTLLGGALGLLVGTGLLVIPGIGPVLAAGPIAAAIGTMTAAVGATAIGAGVGAATGGLAGALIGEGVSEDDAQSYTEAVRRGGRLVMVQAEAGEAERAHTIMQRHGAANIRERADTWRAGGWNGAETTDTLSQGQDSAQRDWTESSKAGTTVGAVSGAATGAVLGSVAGPVGTAVGGAIGAATGAAAGAAGDVAGKHSEHADFRSAESVQSVANPSNRANGFDHYDSSFRSHFDGNYAKSGYTYDQYRDHYRYGYDVANDPRSANRDWLSVEADLRHRWSEPTMGSWEQFRSAVRHAWDRARSAN
jgi:uncharacterized membrane protein